MKDNIFENNTAKSGNDICIPNYDKDIYNNYTMVNICSKSNKKKIVVGENENLNLEVDLDLLVNEDCVYEGYEYYIHTYNGDDSYDCITSFSPCETIEGVLGKTNSFYYIWVVYASPSLSAQNVEINEKNVEIASDDPNIQRKISFDPSSISYPNSAGFIVEKGGSLTLNTLELAYEGGSATVDYVFISISVGSVLKLNSCTVSYSFSPTYSAKSPFILLNKTQGGGSSSERSILSNVAIPNTRVDIFNTTFEELDFSSSLISIADADTEVYVFYSKFSTITFFKDNEGNTGSLFSLINIKTLEILDCLFEDIIVESVSSFSYISSSLIISLDYDSDGKGNEEIRIRNSEFNEFKYSIVPSPSQQGDPAVVIKGGLIRIADARVIPIVISSVRVLIENVNVTGINYGPTLLPSTLDCDTAIDENRRIEGNFMYLEKVKEVKIRESEFSNVSSDVYSVGGVFYILNSSVNVEGSSFRNSINTWSGGFLYLEGNGTDFSLTETRFVDGESLCGCGGAIGSSGARPLGITNCYFFNCYSFDTNGCNICDSSDKKGILSEIEAAYYFNTKDSFSRANYRCAEKGSIKIGDSEGDLSCILSGKECEIKIYVDSTEEEDYDPCGFILSPCNEIEDVWLTSGIIVCLYGNFTKNKINEIVNSTIKFHSVKEAIKNYDDLDLHSSEYLNVEKYSNLTIENQDYIFRLRNSKLRLSTLTVLLKSNLLVRLDGKSDIILQSVILNKANSITFYESPVIQFNQSNSHVKIIDSLISNLPKFVISTVIRIFTRIIRN
jgi:hypothetical protein